MIAAFALALTTNVAAQQLDLAGGDKVLHFGASLVVTDVAYASAALLDAPVWVRIASGVGAGVVVGVAKELYDAAGYGDPSAGDLLYNAFGITAGIGFALAAEAVMARLDESDG